MVAMCASGSRISTSASASMSRGAHRARLVLPQRQRLGVVDVARQRQLLEVEDDVGRVLDHALDRRELVQHAVDLHRGDRRAFDRRQQHAAQRVADGRAETALERLRVEAAEPIGQGLAFEIKALGALKTFPHISNVPFANGPADRPPDLRLLTTLARCRPDKLLERGCEASAPATARKSPKAELSRNSITCCTTRR